MMATEIINVEELTRVAVATQYEPGHAPLLGALRDRYPSATFNLISIQGPWSRPGTAVVDRNGNRVTDDYKKWLTAELHAAGEDAQAVYEKYKASGMRIVETEGDTAVIVVPYSSEPDGFFQIQVQATREKAERLLFGHWFPPQDLQDLLYPSECDDPIELSPWTHKLERVVNVRRFVRDMVELDQARRRAEFPEKETETVRVLQVDEDEPWISEIPFLEMFPDWLELPMPEVRFLMDWQESSAGRSGNRLCDHWWLNLKDYTYQGQRHMSFIPYWASADGEKVPSIEAGSFPSVYALMDALVEFDRKAAYPFAWYFYMLHGNKLGRQVGSRVAEGIKAGKIGLPEQDKNVLLRWAERQYGF